LAGRQEVDHHGDLQGLEDDDHPQYLLADGSRPLSGDLGAGGNRITGLGAATGRGDAVPYEQAIKDGDSAGGDLAGSYPDPTVQGLQNRPMAATAPQNDQVLTWSGNRWEPRDPSATDGNFVQIPPVGIGYAIVAAGLFDGGGQELGPTFNGLRAQPLGNGDYLLTFNGYQEPDEPQVQPLERVVYIVKGTCITGLESRMIGVFQFVHFQPEGIRVRVRSVQGQMLETGFMVEISAYGEVTLG
ncbi:MAG: hypothetical protein R3310_06965, partial [Candidatus Competibacteraceae bacterium]|nr:hypothetical protein [Candidatus Competibacteraceae bacterium]